METVPNVHPLIRHLPNALSTFRLALAVLFPWLTPPVRIAAAIAAAVSDGLDGFIARRFGATSFVGGLLDAISDKLFVGVAVTTLGVEGAFDLWWVPVILLRDLSVAGSALVVLLSREWWAFRHMPPHDLGKLTTGLQFLLIVAALGWADSVPWLLAPTIAAGTAAALIYVVRFWKLRPQR